MKQRIITGVIAGVVFLGLLFLGGPYFQVFVGLLSLIALNELFKMKHLRFTTPEVILASAATLSLSMPLLSKLLHLGTDGPFLLFALFVFIMLIGMVFSKGKYSFEDLAHPFLSAFYVGFGFQALNLARTAGIYLVLLGIFIVWATDIGAYFMGKTFGRHKLIPEVSPNKTIEGSIGGVIWAVVVALIMIFVFRSQLMIFPVWIMLIFTVILSVMGQLGDLVESSIKRHFGVKDSGKILPGHGGILDRFDSMLFVLPLMHLLGLF